MNPEKYIVDVDAYEAALHLIREVNKQSLEDISWQKDGEEVTPKMEEEDKYYFSFTGLSNRDFYREFVQPVVNGGLILDEEVKVDEAAYKAVEGDLITLLDIFPTAKGKMCLLEIYNELNETESLITAPIAQVKPLE